MGGTGGALRARLVLGAHQAVVAALVAARVDQAPLLALVEGHVAAGAVLERRDRAPELLQIQDVEADAAAGQHALAAHVGIQGVAVTHWAALRGPDTAPGVSRGRAGQLE